MSLAKLVSLAVVLSCFAMGTAFAQARDGGGGLPLFVMRPPSIYPPPPPYMSPYRPPLTAPLPVEPVVPVAPPPRPVPPDAPNRVMTDTPEYCFHLARMEEREEAGRTNLPPDVHMLAVTGRQMCEQGLLVGGLARVRLALALLRTGP
jgi:hypothetical protein